MNNNGDLSFGMPWSEYVSTAFPIPIYPLIAPYQADVLTETSGNVWYRSTQDPTLLAKAASDVQSLYGTFSPQWLFIATWDHVRYYSTDSPNEVGSYYTYIFPPLIAVRLQFIIVYTYVCICSYLVTYS